jgi:thioredoxin 1
MADIILTDQNFEEEVLKSTEPVLVDFFASWCHPCQMLGPIIDELGTEYRGKAKVAKLNVDENGRTAEAYGVMSLPTVFFFKDGQPVKSLMGIQAKENYKQELDQLLA